jgi:hypothetical protein
MCRTQFPLFFLSLVASQRPNIPPGTPDLSPTWAVTYQANESSYLYWCNWTAPVYIPAVQNWSILSLDWSTQKWGPNGWAGTSPMDTEERLLEDALNFVAGSSNPSKAKAFTYRNSCKALPWHRTVRAKLSDPQYSLWFLSYGATPPNNGSYFSPPCDPNYTPPLCSTLYHDSTLSPDYALMPRCHITGDCSVQVPGFPYGDGNCSAPACDVGGVVPVGEYIFDTRAWNVSINNQTLGQWWLDEYLFGDMGGANQHIKGFYFDDKFSPEGGCSELDSHQVQDLGLSPSEMGDLYAAYNSNMAELYAEVVKKGAYTEQQFTTVHPPSSQPQCSSLMTSLCAQTPSSLLVVVNDAAVALSMAVYLLARGDYG